MMGDKIKLIMEMLPPAHYTIDINAGGIIELSYNDPKTFVNGVLAFKSDSDIMFVQKVLKSLGFQKAEPYDE